MHVKEKTALPSVCAFVLALVVALAYVPTVYGDVTVYGAEPQQEVSVWDGSSDISWYDEEEDAFILTSAAQLAGLAQIVNNKQEDAEAGTVAGIVSTIPADDFLGKTVKLAVDIDLGGEEISPGNLSGTTWTAPAWGGNEWTPIASFSSSGAHGAGSGNGVYGRPFKGVFDGGFHEIENIYVKGDPTQSIDSALGNSHGLFGDLGPAGLVKNIVIKSGYIRGSRFTGGIVGRNWGHVESAVNHALVETDGSRSGGGITGVNYNNTPLTWVKNCLNFGTVVTGDAACPGGISGDNEGLIENCANFGKGFHKTNRTANPAGGIAGNGRQPGASQIVNSYSISLPNDPDYAKSISGKTAGTAQSSALLPEALMRAELAEFLGFKYVPGLGLQLDGTKFVVGGETGEPPETTGPGIEGNDTDPPVTKQAITSAVLSGLVEKVYTGEAQVQANLQVTLGKAALTKDIDYTVSYADNVNVGTATVTVTGAGNYSGAKIATFVIVPESITKARFAKIINPVWIGREQKPALAITYNAKSLVEGSDFTLRYGENAAIGKGTIEITGKGNYTGKTTKTFKILPKRVALSKVTAGKRQLTVSWKKAASAQGITKYQVQYRVRGANAWETKIVLAGKTSLTIKGLKKGKAYELRVRAYKVVSRTIYDGAWSQVKTSKKIR